jgi:Tripartite tricarboxylate transporter family receptor
VPHLEHLIFQKHLLAIPRNTFSPFQEPDVTRILSSGWRSTTIAVFSDVTKRSRTFSAIARGGRAFMIMSASTLRTREGGPSCGASACGPPSSFFANGRECDYIGGLVAHRWALDYPTRPIHLIVGFPPGGAADLLSRLVGQALSERLGQQIVIENRAGASSNIATEFVVRAAPDGYTLLDVTSVNSWNTALFNNLKFDFIRDLALVGGMYHSNGILVVNPSFPANTLPEFIAYVKANPGKLRMVLWRRGDSDASQRRAFQGDGWCRHAARALSGRRASADRSSRRARGCYVRHDYNVHRARQSGQASPLRRDLRKARTRSPERSGYR